jgi:hypothetical protein
MPTTFTLIASTEIGSGGVSSVTFSSIPTTYNDLMLFGNARQTTSGRNVGYIRMNGTGTYRYLFAEGYATNQLYTSFANTGTELYVGVNASDLTANYFSNFQMYICNYKSTAIKPTSFYTAENNNSASTFYIQTATGQFPSGSDMNSLTIFPGAGSISQYSNFHLYGISYT